MTDREEELFHPATLGEWSAWLAAHHDRGLGVWVVGWRRTSGREVLEYEDLVLEALCWGWVDSRSKGLDAERSMLWFAPRSPRSTWVRSNRDRIARLEAEGRLQPPGRAAVEAARANGMWDLLLDAEAGVVPPRLDAELDVVPGARAGWAALSDAARTRSLTELALARTDATRARRIATIVEACAAGRRPF
ncbi:YdeI/OmpD-associated family protein [Nocardioides fonticola]|uniref:YdeI/OmpD-associated family protein n=1 Tax=Nocardioides fonticola TaxID=450363 RepID=A0ABP7XRC8_9ACTN